MKEFTTTFERLMALFRYRGIDSGALAPGQAKTMHALLEAGQRVAKDLEDLALRQAAMIDASTRELMGSAQALTQPERFKQASESNLATLTKSADTTMRHLAELTELMMKYNREIVAAMNRSMLDSMGIGGGASGQDEEDDELRGAKPSKRRAVKPGKKPG